ncbi:DoxX family protein [Streptosporangium sp. NPDC048865]|uniref:DoxX family protein n=1 Tax=Streptosporangium sp. NPDC048865 TaxID=3155766 RepID=UPI00342FC669
MNLTLWILQAVLAAIFGAAGVLTASLPKKKLEPMLPWAADFSPGMVRFIGLAELAGALGVILPAVTGIAPILTPLAAVGLALIMVLAAITHARRKEPGSIVVNAVLFVAAAIVAWGCFGPYAL